MDVILRDIERALDAGFYYLAIVVTLTLPDICAALSSSDGHTNGAKYKAWYNANLGRKYPLLNGEDCYALRCGVVHQGKFGPAGARYSRVIFAIPDRGNVVHNNILHDALNLDAAVFCQDILSAVRSWFAANQHSPEVQANLPNLVQFRADGLRPFISRVQVIA